jgi:hypothetical protein
MKYIFSFTLLLVSVVGPVQAGWHHHHRHYATPAYVMPVGVVQVPSNNNSNNSNQDSEAFGAIIAQGVADGLVRFQQANQANNQGNNGGQAFGFGGGGGVGAADDIERRLKALEDKIAKAEQAAGDPANQSFGAGGGAAAVAAAQALAKLLRPVPGSATGPGVLVPPRPQPAVDPAGDPGVLALIQAILELREEVKQLKPHPYEKFFGSKEFKDLLTDAYKAKPTPTVDELVELLKKEAAKLPK